MTRKEISLFFSSDHDRIDGFFTEFHKNKEGNPIKAKECFQKFEAQLRQHIRWEEEVLLPLFEEKTGMKGYGPAAVMRQEHNHIQEFLDAMGAKFNAGEIPAESEENELFSLLKSHSHKEEYILYPVIDELTTLEERNDVLQKIKTDLK